MGEVRVNPLDANGISQQKTRSVYHGKKATVYRALVARGNYLAQDRSDIGFAVKELCRSMSDPSEGDWTALNRLGRYLCGKERVVIKYPYQDNSRKLEVWVDTDYAGCRRTRKSTSG